MSRDRYKAKLNKPKTEGNCVVEEKLSSKHSAAETLKLMHKREKNNPPQLYIIDVKSKLTFYHHSKAQMKQNITRLLQEDPKRTLKFSPNYEVN